MQNNACDKGSIEPLIRFLSMKIPNRRKGIKEPINPKLAIDEANILSPPSGEDKLSNLLKIDDCITKESLSESIKLGIKLIKAPLISTGKSNKLISDWDKNGGRGRYTKKDSVNRYDRLLMSNDMPIPDLHCPAMKNKSMMKIKTLNILFKLIFFLL